MPDRIAKGIYFMSVLLINPPRVIYRKHNIWRNVSGVMPPLGLAWIAGFLEHHGHEVKILDAQAELMSLDDIDQWIQSHDPFRTVGITATTPLVSHALMIAATVKRRYSGTRVVMGGVHATVLPEEVLSNRSVDMVVRGEGEQTFLDIVDEKTIDSILGVSWKLDGQIIHNGERPLIRQLDSLPFPSYHLLPMDKYRPALGAAKRLPAISVMATRGCPGKCSFCYRIFGNTFRCRSGSRVAEEIFMLQEKYGIKEVCFYDDTFPTVKKEVISFCEEIANRKLDLTWSCFSRIDTFDYNIFSLMKQTGCHQVMFGVESCDPTVLSMIDKKMNVEKVRWVVNSCKAIGLEVRLAFMLGNPGETEESMEENIRFAISLSPDIVVFNMATPFPGTKMFDWAESNGCLRTKNWSHYDLSIPVMELPTVPSSRVLHYYRTAHRRFYLRPKYVVDRILKIRSLQDVSYALNGIRMIIGT